MGTRSVGRRLVLLGGCALVAVTAAGCGGGPKPLSKAAYDKQMAALGTELSEDLNHLSSVTTAAAGAAALTRLEREIGALEHTLAAITPPRAIKADHAALLAAVRSLASELPPLVVELHHGSLFRPRSVDSLPGIRSIEAAATAIQKAGYVIAAPA